MSRYRQPRPNEAEAPPSLLAAGPYYLPNTDAIWTAVLFIIRPESLFRWFGCWPLLQWA